MVQKVFKDRSAPSNVVNINILRISDDVQFPHWIHQFFTVGKRRKSTMQTVLTIAQLVLALCNICIMVSVFAKFVNKPHDTLEKRVTALEVKTDEHDRALKQGNDRFRDQDDTNEVMQVCMLALIDFEVNYCSHTDYEVTDDLLKAKNTLRDHLARKRKC